MIGAMKPKVRLSVEALCPPNENFENFIERVKSLGCEILNINEQDRSILICRKEPNGQ